MKQFKLNIELENDTFQPNPCQEISVILGTLIREVVLEEKEYGTCIDSNDNVVGGWVITDDY
jgi:hypothetical protein